MDTEVWWLSAVRDRRAPDELTELRQQCRDRGWGVRTAAADIRRDSAGKSVTVIAPDVAMNLYKRIHRANVCVLATASIKVRLNPTRYDIHQKWLVGVDRLIRYKAYYRRVTEFRAALLADFGNWLDADRCDDERDPRVLPLHTFCPQTDCVDLNTSVGRDRFDRRFGPPADRRCEQALRWIPDPSHHGGGREPQYVSGLELTPGLHWDVTGRRDANLLTLVDVYKLPRSSHANVYPDGYIRPGGNAKRVDTVAGRRRPRK